MKNIKVNKDVHRDLSILKVQHNFRSFNELLENMLKQKFKLR